MIGFRRPFHRHPGCRQFGPQSQCVWQIFSPEGQVTVQYWVFFFLGMSAVSLLVARLFSREIAGLSSGAAATQMAGIARNGAALCKRPYKVFAAALLPLLLPAMAHAQPEQTGGGEANLTLPDLSTVNFFGMKGHNLLTIGLAFCVLGM